MYQYSELFGSIYDLAPCQLMLPRCFDKYCNCKDNTLSQCENQYG